MGSILRSWWPHILQDLGAISTWLLGKTRSDLSSLDPMHPVQIPKNSPCHLPPITSQHCLRPVISNSCNFRPKCFVLSRKREEIYLFLCFYWLIWKKLVYYALLLTSLDLNILDGLHLFPWPCYTLIPVTILWPPQKNTLEPTWPSLQSKRRWHLDGPAF